MKTVDTYELEPGMILARDVHLMDGISRVLLLKKGTCLTIGFIDKLINMDIRSVLIADGHDDDVQISSVLTEQQKDREIGEIKKVIHNKDFKKHNLTGEDIDCLDDVSSRLVNIVLESDDLKIGISELKAHDDYTYHHSLSVAVISIAIGIGLGLEKETLRRLGLSALLHDIGKLMIDTNLMNKPGKLSEDEFYIVSRHPLFGAQYLFKHGLKDQDVIGGVKLHHERFDGTGYPYRYKGEQIPLFARIIAVADVYDALTSNRSYRKPNQTYEAFEFIMGGVGSHFDMNVVQAFAMKISPYPNGSLVKLSNGEVAIVVEENPNHPLRPVVRVINTGVVYDLGNDISLVNITLVGSVNEYSNA